MKPLSEKEWRDKLTEISMRIWNVDYELTFEETLKQVEDGLLDTILQDRKAWGEYVIGEDIDFPRDSQTGAPVGTDGFIGLGKSELRAEQRQRNQGEKTDE